MKKKAVTRANAKLTLRQKRFVAEYVVDGNGTRAVKAAGYGKGEAVMAHKLLSNPIVAAAVKEIQANDLQAVKLTRRKIREQLAFLTMRDIIDLTDKDGRLIISDIRKLPRRIRCCIDGLKVRQHTDIETGEVEQEIEVRLAPKLASVIEAIKLKGMAPAIKQEIKQTLGLDWNELYDPSPTTEDTIQDRIDQESK